MKWIPFLLLLFSAPAHAGIVACVENQEVRKVVPNSSPVEGCIYFESGKGMTDAEYKSLLSLTKSSPVWYMKHINGIILEKNATEKEQADQDIARQMKDREILRIDSGNVSGSELMLGLDDLSKDASLITIAGFKEELSSAKLKVRIKKVLGL